MISALQTNSVETTPNLLPIPTTSIMQPVNGQNGGQTSSGTTGMNTSQSSGIHCTSLSSTTQTVNTISTNNTLNSLNHRNITDNNIQQQSLLQNCNDNNENSIPNGYSVHIRASANNVSTNGNVPVSNDTAVASNSVTPYGSTVSTSASSTGSSPPPATNIPHSSSESFSTSNSSSSNYNTATSNYNTLSVNALPSIASSDTLNAFSFFDGLSFPTPSTSTTNNTSSNALTSANASQSTLTSALFNTNPPITSANNNTSSTNNNVLNPLTSSNIVTDETVAQIVSNTSVPEFLYQLTKMLTDDHRDIIEWSNGKIEVHNPTKLEKEVLNQYFRHSKYASFQRQLNYFGFRKLAGKGKMAPCSYVNENATSDLRSLLRMKRKTSATTKDGKAVDGTSTTTEPTTNKQGNGRVNGKKSNSNKRARTSRQQHQGQQSKHSFDSLSSPTSGITIAKRSGIRHQLNGFGNNNKSSTLPNYNSSSSQISSISNPLVPDPMTSLDPVSIAKAAVGKGVTHQYHAANSQNSTKSNNTSNNSIGISNSIMSGIPTDSSNKFTFLDPSQLGMGIENCLSELQTNFRNSLNEVNAQTGNTNDFNSNNNTDQSANQTNLSCTLQRESSLVDLAIIPSLTSALPQAQTPTTYCGLNNKSESDYGMTFIDFPMDNAPLAPPEE